MTDEPHAPRKKCRTVQNNLLPWSDGLALANAAPRCGANTRAGTSCCAPAMANGRCRMHGGLSTGPRTPEGLARSRTANWKHGDYCETHRTAWKNLKEWLEEEVT